MTCQSEYSASFRIDLAGQQHGRRFRLVDCVRARGGWFGRAGRLPRGWAKTRYEGVITECADWFGLSDPENNYVLTTDGEYRFKPAPYTEQILRDWGEFAGMRPMVVLGTASIPAPLIAGGVRQNEYRYNIRQPSDYGLWQRYLESMLDWLLERFPRRSVRDWSWIVGIESDWQARAVDPVTGKEMNDHDNRREYMRIVDTVQAALVSRLGPAVYVGCYFAFESQADDYLAYWRQRGGPRIGWIGVSDWVVPGRDDRNPFSQRGVKARERDGWQITVNSYHAGIDWKLRYLEERLDAVPELGQMELSLPETGYFDGKAAIRPEDGADVPQDIVRADHVGAALHAMRMAAYAEHPRLSWAFNRYALPTGDLSGCWEDDMKPALYHMMRWQRDLHDARVLPVEKWNLRLPEGHDVRVFGGALDRPGEWAETLLCTVHFAESWWDERPARVALDLRGLYLGARCEVTEYRIDREHNNWWEKWRLFRERQGIPFVAGRNYGHLGRQLLLKPQFLPWQNDITGYMPPEYDGVRRNWVEANRDAETLTATRTMPLCADHRGAVHWLVELPGNSVALYRVAVRRRSVDRPVRLWLGPGWEGENVSVGQGSAVLRPAEGHARLVRQISGLRPGRAYSVTATAQPSARVMDFVLHLKGASEVRALGDWSGRPNRLAAVCAASAEGRLSVTIEAPHQRLDHSDQIEVSDIWLIPL